MAEKNLTGKVVLVTGAGRGTGRSLALAFAEQGAVLAVNDISPVNLEPLVTEILAKGGHAHAYIHDIAKKVDVQVMVNSVCDDLGRIDILVNCANVKLSTPLMEIDEWDLHRVFEVNAIGTLLVIQSVGRVMRAQGGGIIVNVIKIPANAPVSFIASQAGLVGMGDRLSAELGQYGLSVFTLTGLEMGDDQIAAVLSACREYS